MLTKSMFFLSGARTIAISKKKCCLFVLWTPKGIKIEKINRDDSFWESKMKKKLTDFYFNCLLPEIIDSRHKRSLSIRDPAYILKAQEVYNEKKKKLEAETHN